VQGYVHKCVYHTQQDDARGEVHAHRAACLFSFLQPYLRVVRGLRKLHRPGYVGFLQCLRNVRHQNAVEPVERILLAA
jgi:hypothetical protein